ncbi:LamG-like jellyroll fold domain-containing protein [Botrimarina hoheduenensis]|uniref:FecR protein n=1 Tax=Botrimarina hoheduenensis TaxID=2528000 RepID=A0A5C5VSA2_9BACT|nr:LamG-like jellyroll fold domain-containing protein [Botrimarina hoheduenensis]TWT40641.1 FecR protein [Botrimarina hoheduenensis]
MSTDASHKWNLEVLSLAESIVNNEATADQVRRLEVILEREESARSLYLDYIDIHAGLRRRYLCPELEGDDEDSARVDKAQPTRPAGRASLSRTWLTLALAMAASIAGVVMSPIILRPFGSKAASPDELADAASLNGVAVLSRLVDVTWSEGAESHRKGAPLPVGSLSIESGLVQVDFYSGAIAVLEGPAQLELISANRAELTSGKLRARVPTRARGFTIATASGEVVDLGTEFAVEAPDGDAPGQLHVIDGEVRYQPALDSDKASVSLREGEAVWLGDEENTAPPAVDAGGFVGPTEVETLARRHSDTRQKQADDLKQRLLQDPDLIALYGYSSEPEWSRLFRNFAPNAGDDTHGSVVGAEWVQGRWPGHKALRFNNPSHRVSISLPGEFDSLTLSTWIAIDRFHATNRVALLHPEINQDRAMFWTLDRVPAGAVLHFAESDNPLDRSQRKHYSSVGQGMFNSDLGRWVHLAVVYDTDLRRVAHYRNGVLVGWQPIKHPRKLAIGSGDLGNWPYKNWAEGTEFAMRNLMGRMDEFVAIGRALSGREIQEMHDLGAP